jgi:NAD(P)-dependent dehydrogenase (short-subunit alcohol dehydrogenase family)
MGFALCTFKTTTAIMAEGMVCGSEFLDQKGRIDMELGLKGRVALVTGGGTGIGKAIAFEFAREGAITYIAGRRVDRLEDAAARAAQEGLKLIPHVLDVRNQESIDAVVNDIVADTGRLDILINNAGFGKFQGVLEQTEEHYLETLDINLKATVFLTKAAALQMKKQKYGVIINASSLVTKIPHAGNAVYAAAKAGVVSLTEAYAGELGPYGIRVLSYAPGMVVTEMNVLHVARDYDKLVDTMALHRLGRPHELAKPVVFLASDAAGYITGVDIFLSGGRYCTQNNEDMWTNAGDEAIVPEIVKDVIL